jgi:hypothetical protein
VLGALSSGSGPSPAVHAQEPAPGPIAVQAVSFAESPALRDVAMMPAPERGEGEEDEEAAENLQVRTWVPQGLLGLLRSLGLMPAKQDPVVQRVAPPTSIAPPLVSFEGVNNADNLASFGFRVSPPDPNGDVGPGHYLQFVNDLLRVFDRSGTPLTPPFRISQLYAALGGICATTDNGDGVVLYDPLGDRWLISQFAFTARNTPPYHECVAISKSGDPTGAYYLYDFVTPGNQFPDYPKVGVWPDAYYMTTLQFPLGGTIFDGTGAFAFQRAKMLVGDPTASLVYFNLNLVSHPEGIAGMLPSDLDGLTPPPPGRPNTFVYFTADEFADPADGLRLFDFHVDFATPANSTFTERPESTYAAPLAVAPFDASDPPDRRDIRQPPPATDLNALDSISDRLLHRLQYRSFGDHETLVVDHTVNVGTGATLATYRAGVRYYALTRALPGGSFSVAEQATFAPNDGNSRWMGSAAMDHEGNLAVGYSVAGPSTFPSIRYAGRLATDPPNGLFQGEETLAAGSGVQLSTTNRWGDYTGLAVDPVDDCTFWYTNEYYTAASQATSTVGWLTRIGSFKVDPSCAPPPMGTLTGTITFSDSGAPIPGALVEVSDGHSGVTLADGTYAIKLPPGTYTVTASDPGRGCGASAVASVVVDDGGVAVFDAALGGPPRLAFKATAVSGGNGNGLIDFNECNGLTVTLENTGCSGEAAISAVLASTTAGVTIEQPNSPYPDAPAAASVANAVPFDVSTVPGFLCGTPIDFALTVTSASGSQVLSFRLPTCTFPTVTGSIGAGDLIWNGSRVLFNGMVSSCATPKVCPGTTNPGQNRRYDKYTYSNPSAVSACVTVSMTSGCGANLFGEAYLGAFVPANVCQNFLGDGRGITGVPVSWAFRVPAGQSFDLVLHEAVQGVGCASYSAVASGLFDGGGECLPCTITCPGPAVIEAANEPGQCGAHVSYEAAVSSGSCGVVTSSPASGSFFPVGDTTVLSSTTAGPSCTRTVTVHDTEGPTIVAPPPVTVSTGPGATSCGAFVADAILGTANAADNCQGVTITRSGVPAGNVFLVGTTTVTYTATDASGHTAIATQTVTVVDDTPPTITAPPPVTRFTSPGATTCDALVTDAMLGSPGAADNCSAVTIARSGVPAGNIFPVGTTVVTYTATDGSGNTAAATQAVTVADKTPPSITGASVDKPVLWPPNHKMVLVTVSYDSTDACSPASCSLSVSVRETQEHVVDDGDDRAGVGGKGQGDDDDWQIIDAHHVKLRAERSGDARERIYTIGIKCQDEVGNSSTRKVEVKVPHDQGHD